MDGDPDRRAEERLAALLGRYALMTAAAELIPLPLLDTWAQGVILRGMLENLERDRAVPLDEPARRVLVDPPRTGCAGLVFAVIWWGVKKIIRTILLFLEAKFVMDVGVRAWHVGLLLDHLLETGRLHAVEDADRVRRALDRTLLAVDVRPIERAVRGPFRGDARMGTRAKVKTEADSRRKAPKTRAERLAARTSWAVMEVVPWIEEELA